MQIRTQPQQRRSRDKHDRVLAAAATLLQEMPYEEIGTKLIADRAGVSVGSLYRFFPDREAIFAALMTTWMDKLVDVIDAQEADPPPSLPAFLDRLVEAYAEFWRAEPGYRQVSLARTAPRAAPDQARQNDEEIADRLLRILTTHYEVPAAGLRPRLLLAVNVAEFLLDKAFRHDPGGDPYVLGEMKLLMRRYLAAG